MENRGDRTGDFLLDRYFPDADEATREEAREDFKRLIHTVLKIALRVEREKSTGADSPESARRPTIPPVP